MDWTGLQTNIEQKKFLFYERNSKVLENEFNKVVIGLYYFTCTSESEGV